MTERIHGIVTGRVQGVSYRWSMEQEAQRLGVGGWVRNQLDGSVEFEAEGRPDAVAALIEWARQGPAYARVSRVETHRVQARGETDFRTTG